MRLAPPQILAAAATLLLAATSALATPDRAVCDRALTQAIPARDGGSPTGSQFVERVRDLSGPERDALVSAALTAGDVPAFLRRLEPVTLRSQGTEITVCVMPDYLAVGSDADFEYVPMGLEGALDVASRFGFVLPTRKLVNAIYEASAVKLAPQPLPAGDQMRSTAYLVRHNRMIGEQRVALGAPLGELTAGHKKDLVLTARLWQVPGRVAIYGWHRGAGAPIQPLSTVHGARYEDYSHGIRLVSAVVYVDGVPRAMADVLADPNLAPLLSDEGPLPQLDHRVGSLLAGLRSAQSPQPVAALASPRSGAAAAP